MSFIAILTFRIGGSREFTNAFLLVVIMYFGTSQEDLHSQPAKLRIGLNDNLPENITIRKNVFLNQEIETIGVL